MGADFSLHKVFISTKATKDELEKFKTILQKILLDKSMEIARSEKEANRSFVLIPENRWIHVGDSAGTSCYRPKDDFINLSIALSRYYPVIDIHMSDSAALHFLQYTDGKVIDKFGNLNFPFFAFKNEEEARPYQGNIPLWKKFLTHPKNSKKLLDTWKQSISSIKENDKSADTIFYDTAKLFGWKDDPPYYFGYSHDYEGIPEKYDEFTTFSKIKLSSFEEIHFKYTYENEKAAKTTDLF